VVPQRRSLVPAAFGQAGATTRSPDDPVEAGMRVCVANEYQSHHPIVV
jgi:hypothetical protein